MRQLRQRVRIHRRGCAGRERRVLSIKQGTSPAGYCAGSYGMYSGCLATGWSAWPCWDANAVMIRRQMGIKFDLTPFIRIRSQGTHHASRMYSMWSRNLVCTPIHLLAADGKRTPGNRSQVHFSSEDLQAALTVAVHIVGFRLRCGRSFVYECAALVARRTSLGAHLLRSWSIALHVEQKAGQSYTNHQSYCCNLPILHDDTLIHALSLPNGSDTLRVADLSALFTRGTCLGQTKWLVCRARIGRTAWARQGAIRSSRSGNNR
jgi:hypothetical protein